MKLSETKTGKLTKRRKRILVLQFISHWISSYIGKQKKPKFLSQAEWNEVELAIMHENSKISGKASKMFEKEYLR
jgi:hypothetical protein